MSEYAFPRPFSEDEYAIFPAQNGMDLRDYFAAKAMQALILDNSRFLPLIDVPEKAYRLADAMLEAREGSDG